MNDLQIDAAPVERCHRGFDVFVGTRTLCVWTRDSFRLELYDTGNTNPLGKFRLAYRFSDYRIGGKPIFEGDDFFASSLDAIDSIATIAALLSFLSLWPGDVDAEAFTGYCARQTEWMELYAEELAQCALNLEEAGR